jgi:hypothetical protein
MAGSSGSGFAGESGAWGQIGLVLITDYDHYGHLKKLGANVIAAVDLLAGLGFEKADTETLTGDGRAF